MAKNLAISNIQVNNQSVSTTPFSILAGDPFDVAWTVSNLGDELIAGGTAEFHIDSVYLSDDNILDTSDVVIGDYSDTTSIAAYTGSYISRQRISILAGTSGTQYPSNRYLIFLTNSGNSFAESDLTDNIVIVPIDISTNNPIDNANLTAVSFNLGVGGISNSSYISPSTDSQSSQQLLTAATPAPDLTIISATAPLTASTGEQISVSWVVQNIGDLGVASGSRWYDNVYLSSDTIFSSNDINVGGKSYAQELPVGSSYSASNASLFIPTYGFSSSTATIGFIGNQYLLFVTNYTDFGREQFGGITGETNLSNNTYAAPILISTPDLLISMATAPTTVKVGSTIAVSWTVKNNSASTASGYWTDKVYLSSDQILDANDLQLTDLSVGPSFSTIKNPILPNGEYSATKNITINGVAGLQYLIFSTDAPSSTYTYGNQAETNEANNLFVTPITITASDLRADSVITTSTSIDFAKPFDVTWSVTNVGTEGASGTWKDKVYLSRDRVLSNDDLLLTSQNKTATLASGASYTATASVKAEKPTPLPVDAEGFVGEVEPNNTVATALNLQQNFVLSSGNTYVAKAKGVSDASGVPDFYRFSASPGDVIDLAMTSATKTAFNGFPQFEIFDRNQKSLAYNYGDNKLSLTLSSNAYAGDYYFTARSFSAAEQYTVTVNLQTNSPFLPTLNQDGNYEGNYYVLVNTNSDSSIVETSKANNNVAGTAPIFLGTPTVYPDLIIGGNIRNNNVIVGSTFPVSWNVTNISPINIAQSGWFDYVYLSDDNKLDGTDILLGGKERANTEAALAVGASYTVNNQNITLPTGIVGEKNLIFVVDGNNNRQESNETNNISVAKIQIADLVVSSITAPAVAFSGKTAELNWTMTNRSTFSTNADWTNYVYLSYDDVIGNDIYLGAFDFSGTLAAGQSIDRQQTVQLLTSDDRNYRFVIKTDAPSLQANATGSNATIDDQAIQIIQPQAPNLIVSNITLPATTFSGRESLVQWTVTNVGNEATDSPSWYDGVYLSVDTVVDRTDVFLGSVENPSYLNTNDSYNKTLKVSIPQKTSGAYYYLVKTDIGSQVGELITSDNTGFRSVIITPTPSPDLQITEAKAPAEAFSGQSISLRWVVANQGLGITTETDWQDGIFLSKNAILDDTDIQLGDFKHTGALNPNESYIQTGTVNLPVGLVGDYYFFVQSDVANQVFENLDENNNSGLTTLPTAISLTPPPDLEFISLTLPSNIRTGETLNIKYRVDNFGATETPNSRWSDAFYLSVDDKFDATTDILLGTVEHIGNLNPDRGYDGKASFGLGNTLAAGTYYVFGVTDNKNEVFELDNANNVYANVNQLQIVTQHADLAVTNAIIPATGQAGKSIQVQWTVKNQGTGSSIATQWDDRIIASIDGIIGNTDDVILGTYSHNGQLAAGDFYNSTQSITIPFALKGNYQVFVNTDFTDKVFEDLNEVNNVTTALPLAISRETPDLQVTIISAPSVIASGQPLLLNWTVLNVGVGKTNSNNWNDSVYLSLDNILDGSDILLGSSYHAGELAANATYNGKATFNIPIDANGNYQVLVKTDSNDEIMEGDSESNNTQASALAVSLSPVPNLVVQSITAPIDGIAGQSIGLSWTVANIGAAITTGQDWYDAVYLSRDTVFDKGTDFYLGYQKHSGGLDENGNYTITSDFDVPRGLSGKYFALVVTDSKNSIYERSGENNNVGYGTSTAIVLPPLVPSDLVVTDVTVPVNGILGQPVTISYTVQNQGTSAAVGKWSEALYLSSDTKWDINDVAIGQISHVGDVASGDSYNGSLTVALPGVNPENYHVIVRSDIRNQVIEVNEANNFTTSNSTISLDVQSLILEAPVKNSLSQEQSVYYRFSAVAGQTVRLKLDSDDDSSLNGLYVRYGNMPTPGQFDLTTTQPYNADPEIIIPIKQTGTYYVLAKGEKVVGTPNYKIVVQDVPFSITEVATKTIGNYGKATIEIHGAQFQAGTTFQLRAPNGSVTRAEKIYLENSSLAYVTFDVANGDPGLYGVEAQQNGSTASLDNSITIEDANGSDIIAQVSGPAEVRFKRSNRFFVNYENKGDADEIAPLLIVESDTFTPFGTNPDKFTGSRPLQLLGISDKGPQGILRPGESSQLPMYFFSEFNPINFRVHSYSAYDSTVIDWKSFESSIRPTNLTDAQWDSFFSNIASRVNTYGEYVKLLNRVSQQLSTNDNPLYDVREIFGKLYQVSPNFIPGSVISGQLLDKLNNAPLANQSVVISEFVLDDNGTPNNLSDDFEQTIGVKTVTTDTQGRFTSNNLSAASYRLTSPDYSFDEQIPYIATEGKDITSLILHATSTKKVVRFVSSDSSPSLTKDSLGNTHLLWSHNGELWHAINNGGVWQKTAAIPNAFSDSGKILSGVSLDGGEGLLVSWRSGSDNDSELFYSIGRLKNTGNSYEWTAPIQLTNNLITDDGLDMVVTNAGKPIFSWQKHDSNINDQTDLYFKQISAANPVFINDAVTQTALTNDFSGSLTSTDNNQITTSGFFDSLQFEKGAFRFRKEYKFDSSKFKSPFDSKNKILKPLSDFLKKFTEVQGSVVAVGAGQINCTEALASVGLDGKASFKSATNLKAEVAVEGRFRAKWSAAGTCPPTDFKLKTTDLNLALTGAISNGLKFDFGALAQSYLPASAYKIIDSFGLLSWFKGKEIEVGIRGESKFQYRYYLTDSAPAKHEFTALINGLGYGSILLRSKGIQNDRERTFLPSDEKLEVRVGVAGFLRGRSDLSWDGGANINFTFKYDYNKKVVVPGYFDFLKLKYVPESFYYVPDNYNFTIVVPIGNSSIVQPPSISNLVNTSILEKTNSLPNDKFAALGLPVDYSEADGSDKPVAPVNDSYDGKPSLARNDVNGQVWSAWSTLNGIAVSILDTSSNTWSIPNIIALGGQRGSDPSLIFDQDGDGLLVWSNTDFDQFNADGSPVEFEDILANGEDLSYSLYDKVQGAWTSPVSLFKMLGNDGSVSLFRMSDGNVVASWMHQDISINSALSSLYTVFWDAINNTWSIPQIVYTDSNNIKQPVVSEVEGVLTVMWSEDIPDDSGNTSLKSSTWNGLKWDNPSDFNYTFSPTQFATASDIPLVPSEGDLISDSEIELPDLKPPNVDEECDCKKNDYDPKALNPRDPNDIIGPTGFGENHWIAISNPLKYTIRFENAATATAPAQDVIITQQMDDDLDWRTFRIDDYGWSGDIYSLAGDKAFYSTRLDLTATKGIYVNVTASIDITTGIATWKLSTIDPKTGEAPISPLTGLLPINDANGAGEGFVSYSIKAKKTAKTGDIINAKATIIFDTEEPIDTPAIFNTLDASTPESRVQPLSATTDATEFLVSWSGTDVGSALANYTIYVSDNGGAYASWKRDTQLTEEVYKGVAGHSYKFYSVATDNAGNTQATPIEAQATILVNGGAGSIGDFVWIDSNADGIQNSGELGVSNITVKLYNSPTNVVATTTTSSTGLYKFTDLVAGQYSLEFVAPSGYLFSPTGQGVNPNVDSDPDPKNGRTSTFNINAGEDLTKDAGLYQLGSISGTNWSDTNGNGQKDATEIQGLAGWTIYLDANGNGLFDSGETNTITNANGSYSFSGLTPGNYTVAQVVQPGWTQTYPRVTVSTKAADVELFSPDIKLAESATISSATAKSVIRLIDLQGLWQNPQFANIKGGGLSTVVIDTGIDLNHPFFGPDGDGNGIADRIVYQYDFADNDTDASDRTGHGSHVASIAAQIAPDANLIVLKVFKDSSTGSFAYLEKALQWVNQNVSTYNIASVNLSLGDGLNWNSANSRYGIGDELTAISAQNVIVAAAAGNNYYQNSGDPGLAYPAADPNTISVGALWSGDFGGPQRFGNGAIDYTTAIDRIASFSQRDQNQLDIFAPGIFISGANATGGTQSLGGTSQATPFVSGIAVLAQQIALEKLGRKLNVAEFRQLLATSSFTVKDGDDENDNVANTGFSYPQIDLLNLANEVAKFNGIGTIEDGNNTNTNGTGTALPTISGAQILTHLVTLKSGQIVTDKNFGSQQNLNRPKNDFGKDNKSDILWRNTDGRVVIWQMDGSSILSDAFINRPAPLDWQIAETGDFNGDGKSDILWRNTDGRVVIWQMNGTEVLSDAFINRPAPLDWQIVSTNDFNGDGKSDILWRNTDGRVVIWQMNGTEVLSDAFINRPAPLDWQIVSTNDFNGDGKSDILWRNTDGRVVVWQMDGATVLSDKFIDRPAPLDWQIVSTNDFNGDGKSDILWRNTDGRVVIWRIDGTTVLSDSFIDRPAPLDWTIAGTGDLNGDGKSDILWRNNDGRVVEWLMDGTTVLADNFVSNVDNSWQIVAPKSSLPIEQPIKPEPPKPEEPNAVKNDFGNDYKSDILWRNTDSRVAIWQMNGSEVISDAFINRPAPLDWQIVSTGDFNGDKKSDILWRNTDGRVAIWQMNGTEVISDAFINRPAPLDWQIVSTGDFNGDKKSDILWRNTDGRVVIWQMNGTEVLSDAFINRPAPLDWQIVSTGDFNGDGKSDILWRNTDGRVVIWQMNGTEVLSDNLIDLPASLDWQIISTGDFNGDKKSDILWRNTDGRVVIWQMNGSEVLSDTFIERPAPLDWQIAGTGDLNGDGKSDILWRNNDGRVVEWLMDGTTVLADNYVANVDNIWQIVAPTISLPIEKPIAPEPPKPAEPNAVKNDFGKDYRSDILWRNTDSRVVIWQMNGSEVLSDAFIDRPAPLDWQIVSTGDFDGDKKSDILWRNTDSRVVIWQMNGTEVISDAFIDRPAPLDWQIVSTGDFDGDKKSDILWRNTDSRVVIWQMNGTEVISDAFIDRPAPLDWQIVSTNDFNGDGKSDILWRNNDGRVVIWQMNGTEVLSDTFINRPAPLDWQIAGTGDFNGDRKSDILWRNTEGRIVTWQMNGSEVLSDTFIDRPAPLDWQIAGTVDLNGDGKSDILWRNNDGRVVEWLLDGSTVLADNYVANVDNSWQIVAPTISLPIEKPTFLPEPPKPIEPNAVKNDFGKDYKSDILWRNTDGRVVIWQMDGSSVLSDSFIDSFAYTGGDRPAPLDWQIASTGDFNGDKKSDILWRNNDGRVVVWQMNGTEVLSDAFIDRPAPLDWQIAGTGDFNGDKKSDILWRNNDGRVVIWQMDGTAVLSDAFIDRPAPLDWQIAGTGDFNGDRKSDILWRNTDGRVAIWQMDGATVLSDTFIDRPISNDWVIEGVDDFSNDGKSDILWRNNNSGLAYIYEMNNNSIINEGIVGQADVEWQVAGTGDYNGDAYADILWRNDSGLTYLWTMNGLNQLGQKSIKQVDNSWQISAPIG
jgi:RNAse (barnase) inhibitor barstar